MSSGAEPVLAVSCGDPAGIGGEILAGAWARLRGEAPFVLIGDADWAGGFGAPAIRVPGPEAAAAAIGEGVPVVHRPLAERPTPGRPSGAAAAAVIESVETAVAWARAGRVAGVVTLPVSKRVLAEGAGFAHPGHTEFLAALTGAPRPVMMLAGPSMRVVPATIHVPLAEVAERITVPLLLETARILAADLGRWFGLARPRIAVAGLNPHAGEGGRMGREEIETVAPAVEAMRAEGIDATGPVPGDALFTPRARAGWDAALCMYHDQALIPLKALDFDRGVNVTLGLPIVRTSPDHGTAFDIAGRGIADPTSLVEALRLAAAMAARAR